HRNIEKFRLANAIPVKPPLLKNFHCQVEAIQVEFIDVRNRKVPFGSQSGRICTADWRPASRLGARSPFG
ncbi:hypothetical protein, partial [Polaromonas sp. DSP2-3-2b2]|uniref:hypothetical protein n=1 Tax=Polaromonas sp. DSP2-3-2b2 TaxID=2804662 RepID=UPI003CF6F21C